MAGSSIGLSGSLDLRVTKAGTARAVLSREVTFKKDDKRKRLNTDWLLALK